MRIALSAERNTKYEIRMAKYREDTYAFLAGIFREELNREQIGELTGTGLLDLLVDAGCDIAPDFFRNRPVEKVEEELAVEYASLFIGPGRHIPPYESIHIPDGNGKRGSYWGECTVDLKSWVERYGLVISGRFESIPDHISIELEFMQKMIEQERLAWERNDIQTAERCIEVERAFFKKHINNWVPLFCDKVMEAAVLDFYREIAGLTKNFVLEEENLW